MQLHPSLLLRISSMFIAMSLMIACGDSCSKGSSTGADEKRPRGELLDSVGERVGEALEIQEKVDVEVPEFAMTDGRVMAITEDEERIYIGGDFAYVMPYVGNLLVLDGESAVPATAWAQVHGIVRVAIPAGDGGWYIGGDFRHVGDLVRKGLAKLRADGSVDAEFTTQADASVSALLLEGDVLYVGGAFRNIGGESRHHVAALQAKTGEVKSWNPGADGPVMALESAGEVLYIGGRFFSVQGEVRVNLAAVRKDTAEVTSWNPQVQGSVRLLVRDGDGLYVGGGFNRVDESRRSNLAAFSVATGELMAWGPMVDGAVDALAISDGDVYIGGDFESIGGVERKRLAGIDGKSGALTEWDPGANARVLGLTIEGGTVYVGGDFTEIGGASRARLAALDKGTGTAKDWNHEIVPGPGTRVYSVGTQKELVFVGGEFRGTGGVARQNLAAFDKRTGELLDWSPKPNGLVNALEIAGDNVYLAGRFTEVSGERRSHLAVVNRSNGAVAGWNPVADGEVYSLTLDEDRVYVMGDFQAVGGAPRRHLAALDRETGTATGWDPRPDGRVVSLAIDGAHVYVGGGFKEIGGKERAYLAVLDRETGEAGQWLAGIAQGVSPWVEFVGVSALALEGETLYAGGMFGQAGGEVRWSLAAFDKSSGALKDWNPMAHGSVMDMVVAGDLLYVSGDFGRVGGENRPAIAALDRETGRAMAWNPMATRWVSKLLVTGDLVFAGGAIEYLDGQLRDGFGAVAASAPFVAAPSRGPRQGEFTWRDALKSSSAEANEAIGHYTVYHGCNPARRLPSTTPENRQFWLAGAPFCYFEKEPAPHHETYRIRAIMYSEDQPVILQIEPRQKMAFGESALEALGLPKLAHIHRRGGAPLAPTGRNVISYRPEGFDEQAGSLIGFDLFSKPLAPAELDFVRIYAMSEWSQIRDIVAIEGPPVVGEQIVLPLSQSLFSPDFGLYAEFGEAGVRLSEAPIYPRQLAENEQLFETVELKREDFFGVGPWRGLALNTWIEAYGKRMGALGMEVEPVVTLGADRLVSATELTALMQAMNQVGVRRAKLLGSHIEVLAQVASRYGNVNMMNLDFASTAVGHEERGRRSPGIRLTATISPAGIGIRGLGAAIDPLPGCPANGPTICLVDPSVNVVALLSRAREEQTAGRLESAETFLQRALAAYDWARYYEVLSMIKAEYPQEEALYFIAEGDPALAILVRAMDVARYKLRPRGERGECARGFKDNAALERAVFCMGQGTYGSEFQELFGYHVLTRAFR